MMHGLKDVRPYMLHAHIQWLEDSGAVPHLVIQNGSKTRFPAHLSANSLVTFRITKESIRHLHIDDEGMSFSARFSGKEFTIFAPLDCLIQLHSEDGRVVIQLQQPTEIAPSDVRGVEHPVTKPRPFPAKPALTVEAGGTSDSVKRGKLSLVPKSKPRAAEPGEPECA